jgi:hypothetical protein
MAQAHKVRVGQVWTDARGRRLEVLELQGSDGKFGVRNLESNRTMRRGPRALVSLERDFGPPSLSEAKRRPPPKRGLSPAQIAAGFGGGGGKKRPKSKRPPSGPRLAMSPPSGVLYHGVEEGEPWGQWMARTVEAERAVTAPPPPGPPDPHLSVLIRQTAASDLVAHVVLELLALPPERAHNPLHVDRAFAKAKTDWKLRRRGGR